VSWDVVEGVEGYATLEAGQRVYLTWESGFQDGFVAKATSVRPIEGRGEPLVQLASICEDPDAFGSVIRIQMDESSD
jgi:hypothetical protein